MNDAININTTISGDASPEYFYTARDVNFQFDIHPAPPGPNKGNGPDVVIWARQEGFLTLSISIQDYTATDDGDNYPAVQFWVVDAKTWESLFPGEDEHSLPDAPEGPDSLTKAK